MKNVKAEERRGSSLQPRKADNISKAFELAFFFFSVFLFTPNTQRQNSTQFYRFLQHLDLELNITSTHVLHKTQIKIGHVATLCP